MAHVVVENQVALGEATPVPATLDRLMDEGLDRHDATSHRVRAKHPIRVAHLRRIAWQVLVAPAPRKSR